MKLLFLIKALFISVLLTNQSFATDCMPQHAVYPAPIKTYMYITTAEVWNTDYVGVMSEGSNAHDYEWGVVNKPINSYTASHI